MDYLRTEHRLRLGRAEPGRVVVDVDRAEQADALRAAGADVVVADPAELLEDG